MSNQRTGARGLIEARTLGLGFLVGLALALSPGCPPASTSCSSTCKGCCDSKGQCQDGTSDAVCGTGGQMCGSCGKGTACKDQQCVELLPDGGVAEKDVTLAQFVERYPAAYCDWQRRCFSLDPSVTDAECQSSVTWVAEIRQQVTKGLVDFNTKAGACMLNAIVSCGESDACPELVTPKGKTGENCSSIPRSSAESTCGEGLWCIGGDICSRRCIVGGALDEPCRYKKDAFGVVSYECNTGLYCSINQRCAPLIPRGEPCPDGSQCVAPAYCNMDTGTCDDPAPIGASCEQVACVDDAYCDFSEDGGQNCVRRLAHGAACTEGYQCPIDDDCKGGTCRASQVGDSCTGYCTSGLVCDDVLLTCQRAAGTNLADGTDCSRHSDCANKYCRGLFINTDGGPGTRGKCGTRMSTDPCDFDEHCPRGEYCNLDNHQCAGAAPGSPCSTSARCQATDYCFNQTCTPRADTNGQCEASYRESCVQAGDLCAKVGDEAFAKCRRPGKVGEKCSADSCSYGLFCGSSGVCVVAGHLGQPCAQGLCYNSVCRSPDGGINPAEDGVCLARPTAGGPCYEGECAAGFVCDTTGGDGVCKTACP